MVLSALSSGDACNAVVGFRSIDKECVTMADVDCV